MSKPRLPGKDEQITKDLDEDEIELDEIRLEESDVQPTEATSEKTAKPDKLNQDKKNSTKFTAGELDATRLYLNEIGFSPLLTAEEEVYFSRKALRGDESARKRMIESNLRLLVKIARRYMNRGTRVTRSNWRG